MVIRCAVRRRGLFSANGRYHQAGDRAAKANGQRQALVDHAANRAGNRINRGQVPDERPRRINWAAQLVLRGAQIGLAR